MTYKPENHLSVSQYKWFAIYSKYRCEKLVFDHLIKKQIHAYLPLTTSPKKKGSRRRLAEIPLIPNYVFVKITNKEYVKVLETIHVRNFVKIANNLISIPEEEINTLKRFVENKEVSLVSNVQDFVKGDWVEIISGSLTGIQGMLVDIKGKKNICVKLDTIGFSLQLEVSVNVVKKIKRQGSRAN